MNWGVGMGFSVESARARKKAKDTSPPFNPLIVCDYYHRFLELLHSLDLYPRGDAEYRGEGRMFWSAPSYAYNFDPIKSDGKKVLKKYGLDLDKINALRINVGQLAIAIDPLERWHYYIARHSQAKRDLLKGDAGIAQELYVIYDFLTKIHEMVSGQKPPPIFEFLHQKHFPYLMPRTEYQTGEDLKALQFAVHRFKGWSGERKNKPFVTQDIIAAVDAIGEKLADYEKRYGDRSAAGSFRYYNSKGKKLEDLDEETKNSVLRLVKQLKDQKMEFDMDDEIGRAIMHRLSDLKHELRDILWKVSEQLRNKENAAWAQEQRLNATFWHEHHEELSKLNHEQQLALSKKEHDKFIKEAEGWADRAEEFNRNVADYTELVFCGACRKNPIQLHIENTNRNSMEISRSLTCDDCIKNKKLSQMSQGEWTCWYCGQLLSKFAQNNLLSHLTVKGYSEIKVELEYGKIEIEALCNNCKQVNIRPIEWGWLP